MLLLVRLLEVVGAVALVARLALGQRVDELGEVAGRLPHPRGQDDRGVQADDVVADLHHRAPPLAADVLLELDAQGPVVPGGAGAAVDLAGRVDETPTFREIDDQVVAVGRHGSLHPAGGRWAVRQGTCQRHRTRTAVRHGCSVPNGRSTGCPGANRLAESARQVGADVGPTRDPARPRRRPTRGRCGRYAGGATPVDNSTSYALGSSTASESSGTACSLTSYAESARR